jgi:ArsR family transcriptional regulator
MKQSPRTASPATCSHTHELPPPALANPAAIAKAAGLFRAMGDPARLGLLQLIAQRECCVSELVDRTGEKFSTISQRLKLLRTEGLIVRRREGLHLFYSLADAHVRELVANALAHAAELLPTRPVSPTADGPGHPASTSGEES